MTEFKLNNIHKIAITLVLLFSNVSHANLCLRRIVAQPKSVQTVESLIEKMEDLGISLKMNEVNDFLGGSNQQEYLEITAFDETGEPIGEVSMIPTGNEITLRNSDLGIYESHIDIYPAGRNELQGVGLGAYLYISAARAVHRLGGVLFSSTGPSSMAVDAWERLVAKGWVTRGFEGNDELLLSQLPITVLSAYRFRHDLLSNGFFDDLDEVLEDEDMLFIRHEELN